MVNVFDAGNYDTSGGKTAKERKSNLSAAKIANNLAMGFNLIASIRGDHWRKSSADCTALAEPLAAWLETQTAATKAMMEQYMLPLSLLFGLIMILSEPIQVEIEYIKAQHAERNSRVRVNPIQGTAPRNSVYQGAQNGYAAQSAAGPAGPSGDPFYIPSSND